MTTTAVKERPILMQPDMVLATLNGTKTQTRRMRGLGVVNDWLARKHSVAFHNRRRDGLYWFTVDGEYLSLRCPYGSPGERLWVRESYAPQVGRDGFARGRYSADAAWFYAPSKNERHPGSSLVSGRTVPSIHMPRWASRLLLEITDVRVQRVQEISERDARAEGVQPRSIGRRLRAHQRSFKYLWSEINGNESWDFNPYVWAITFKKAEIAWQRTPAFSG